MDETNASAAPNLTCLHQRARLLRQVREFFDQRGFSEVQPPCLAHDCVVDPYIDPIAIDSKQFGLSETLPQKFHLQTSPELAMKRMLAGGAPSIYSIGPVFRAGEMGRLHNIEFTMLEWYEVGADYQKGIQLLGELAIEVFGASNFDLLTYRRMFLEQLGFDPVDASLDQLKQSLRAVDRELVESLGDDRDGILDVLLTHCIQPSLGQDRPVIVCDYPISQAALAKAAEHDPACALRFELFYRGVELANGYDELTDPDELLERTKIANQKRTASGRQNVAPPQSLIESMRIGLPQCAGVALGFDRLLMLKAGETELRQVMAFTSRNA